MRSGLVCDRIGGVKLKLYSGSADGRSFQPLTRSQKNGSPGFTEVFDGNREIARCVAESVGVVKAAGLIEVVCERFDGSSWPYLVEGASLSSKIMASSSLRPEKPIETSVSS